MKKQLVQLIFAAMVMTVVAPVLAADVRLAAGGLARDKEYQVVQVGVVIADFQPTYTAWHDQRALSLLYTKRWEYFEIGGGAAYVANDYDNNGAAAHARLGPRFGPFFVSYEALIRNGEAVRFILGGVQIAITAR